MCVCVCVAKHVSYFLTAIHKSYIRSATMVMLKSYLNVLHFENNIIKHDVPAFTLIVKYTLYLPRRIQKPRTCL